MTETTKDDFSLLVLHAGAQKSDGTLVILSSPGIADTFENICLLLSVTVSLGCTS